MPPSSSLANKLKDDRESFIANYYGQTSTEAVITHFLDLQDNYECQTCASPTAKATMDQIQGRANEDIVNLTEMLIWCMPCDRVFHLLCAKVTELEGALPAPWTCNDCSKETEEMKESPSFMFKKDKKELASKKVAFRINMLRNKVPKWTNMQFLARRTLFESIDVRYTKSGDLEKASVEKYITKIHSEASKHVKKAQELESQLKEKESELAELKRKSLWDKPCASSTQRFSSVVEQKRLTVRDLINGTLLGHEKEDVGPEMTPLPEPTAHKELTSAQPDVNLREIRANLPKIKKFGGEPLEWLQYEHNVESNIEQGQYTGRLAKNVIRDSLEGEPYDRLHTMLHSEEFTYSHVMSALKKDYGHGRKVIEAHKQKVLELNLKPLTYEAVRKATTVIMNYLNACSQAKVEYFDSQLSNHIHKQLDDTTKRDYLNYFAQNCPGQTRDERLDIQVTFLQSISEALPFESKTDKGTKTFQVNAIASHSKNQSQQANRPNSGSGGSNKQTTNDTSLFNMADSTKDPLKGYNWQKVKTLDKKCYMCDKTNHYTPQCQGFQALTTQMRWNVVDSKTLCACCLLTDEHKASRCDIRLACGHITGNFVCSYKHHECLHQAPSTRKKGFDRRNNKKSGDDKKDEEKSDSKGKDNAEKYKSQVKIPNTKLCGTMSKAKGSTSVVLSTSAASSTNTIKMFRVQVRNGKKSSLTFAAGDSCAECTIIQAKLARELGIKGEKTKAHLQWTNEEIMTCPAEKVSIRLKGILPGAKEFVLKECLAIEDFNLPPRSLNVDELRKKFNYLKEVPFVSYYDAAPQILIGTRDGCLVEAQQAVLHGGLRTPIAIKTPIGYSIYGGENQDTNQLLSVSVSELDEKQAQNEVNEPKVDEALSEEEFGENLPTNKMLSEQLEYGFSIDSLGIRPVREYLTENERSAIAQAKKGIKQLANGFIQMPHIWKLSDSGDKPTLPNNLPMVLKRQIAQEKKLQKHPELLAAFNINFKKLIDEEYVRAATQEDMKVKINVNYIPMSLVVNANKSPPKTRNVYDASAKYKGTSLNDNLLQGPNMLVDLLTPLMYMRENKVAFTGDIKSMFHRIRIDPEDVQTQRILWRETQDEDMQVYIQQSMLFGPNSSPFCSQFAKNWAADHFRDVYPDAANLVENMMYMDDLLASARNATDAINLIKQCIEILGHFKMDLIGFQSNSREVLQAIPHTHLKEEAIPLTAGNEEAYKTRVLGVNWLPLSDVFSFDIDQKAIDSFKQDQKGRPTKRQMCSFLARMFDVLGLITSCTIRGKMLLQRAWEENRDWDDSVSEKLGKQWLSWLDDLQSVTNVRLPRQRFANLDSLSDAEALELHTCIDAGGEAYAAVAYLVAITNGTRYSSFVIAKAKVTPIKLRNKNKVTEVPRLELLACLLGARLAQHILRIHKHLNIKQFMWTDSEICLKWLWNANAKLPRFAVSPVDEILEVTMRSQWRHVPSELNVADLATKSKGKLIFSDAHSTWHVGPDFITKDPMEWPKQTINLKPVILLAVSHIEQRLDRKVVHNSINDGKYIREDPLKILKSVLPHENCSLCPANLLERFYARKASITSSWSKMTRACARSLKVYFDVIIPIFTAKRWRDRKVWKATIKKANLDELTSHDLERGELFIVRYMQMQAYSQEREQLAQNKPVKNKELIQLNCFLDKDGIIRINSRIDLPYAEYPQKWAPLIPRMKEKNSLTMLLMQWYHKAYRHISLEAQIADFRTKFWMTAIREWLKSCNYDCNHCYLRRQGVFSKHLIEQGALPDDRINLVNYKPFEVVGIDCAGPFQVIKDNKNKKVWVVLMTCTVTRFTCCYTIDKMDSLSIIKVISNVCAHHGSINKIYSDHGTNFIGAANRIQKEQRLIEEVMRNTLPLLEEYNAKFQKTIEWKFLPIQAAWYGGFYERLIKEIKRALKEEFKGKIVDLDEFELTLSEATLRLNKRPLTHNSTDCEEEEPLTPFHLALNRPGGESLPSAHNLKVRSNEKEKLNETKDYYRKVQAKASQINKRFMANYLPKLTLRTKEHEPREMFTEGDLVILFDLNNGRHPYVKGRIAKIYGSRDNQQRIADIVTPDGAIKKRRSLQHVVKLKFKSN